MDENQQQHLSLEEILQMAHAVALCREYVLRLHEESSETTADTIADMDT